MFTLDLIVLNLLRQLYNRIFPWPDHSFYGAGEYAKYIITIFFIQQCFFVIYAKKTKKKGDKK